MGISVNGGICFVSTRRSDQFSHICPILRLCLFGCVLWKDSIGQTSCIRSIKIFRVETIFIRDVVLGNISEECTALVVKMSVPVQHVVGNIHLVTNDMIMQR
jgi:hypothetical protein